MINDLYEVKNIIYEMKNISSSYSKVKDKIHFFKNEHIYNLNHKITQPIYKIIFILLTIEIFFKEPFFTLKSLVFCGIIYVLNYYIIHNKFNNSSIIRAWNNLFYLILIILTFKLFFKLGVNNTIIALFIIFCTFILNKVIIPFITFTFFSSKIKSIDNEDKINILEIELENLYKRFNYLENKLNNSFLPNKYKNLNAIDFFISCLENKRADTLKELINLYESELRYQEDKNRYENEITNLKNEIKKTKKLAQKAKSDATFSILISRIK